MAQDGRAQSPSKFLHQSTSHMQRCREGAVAEAFAGPEPADDWKPTALSETWRRNALVLLRTIRGRFGAVTQCHAITQTLAALGQAAGLKTVDMDFCPTCDWHRGAGRPTSSCSRSWAAHLNTPMPQPQQHSRCSNRVMLPPPGLLLLISVTHELWPLLVARIWLKPRYCRRPRSSAGANAQSRLLSRTCRLTLCTPIYYQLLEQFWTVCSTVSTAKTC